MKSSHHNEQALKGQSFTKQSSMIIIGWPHHTASQPVGSDKYILFGDCVGDSFHVNGGPPLEATKAHQTAFVSARIA